ncbi:MAG: hypothetical protein QM493_00660 [Sulfurovum sp.]
MVSLKFGMGEVSISNENKLIESKVIEKIFDCLLFFDSRGIVDLFIKELDKKKLTYLIITRPKNLTIFATLYNFLKLNPKLKFRNLITNLGFVDCTPKKQKNIDDIVVQIEQFSNSNYSIIEHENYELSHGSMELLKSIKYSKNYIKEINKVFNKKFYKCYFINTPIVSKDMKMNRKRPASFFTQLYKTNELINDLVTLNVEKNILIDIKDLHYTYDGVHYTKEGHEIIFNKIKESINL